jgi:hypothetical protein
MKEIDRKIMNYNFIEKIQEKNPDIKYNPEILYQKDLCLKEILKIQNIEKDNLQELEDKQFQLEEEYLETRNTDLISEIEEIRLKINLLTN